MTISVTKNENEKVITISISGRFDFSLHGELRNAYRYATDEYSFIVNLRDTQYLDSSALGMLLLLREHVGNDYRKLKIVGCKNDVRAILEIANIDKLINIA